MTGYFASLPDPRVDRTKKHPLGDILEGVEHDDHEQTTPRKEQGRHEERYTTVIDDPKGLPPGWPDVAAVVLVGREREIKGKRTETVHYDITSHRGTAAELGRLIRRHWGIEDQLQWSLDVRFREDRNQTARGHAGTNLSLIRKVALSLLRQDPGRGASTGSASMRRWMRAICCKPSGDLPRFRCASPTSVP